MPLVLELNPETETRLEHEAVRRGMKPNSLALKFIEDSLPIEPAISLEEAEALLDALADGNAPVLPPEANSRAYYYQDHD